MIWFFAGKLCLISLPGDRSSYLLDDEMRSMLSLSKLLEICWASLPKYIPIYSFPCATIPHDKYPKTFKLHGHAWHLTRHPWSAWNNPPVRHKTWAAGIISTVYSYSEKVLPHIPQNHPQLNDWIHPPLPSRSSFANKDNSTCVSHTT